MGGPFSRGQEPLQARTAFQVKRRGRLVALAAQRRQRAAGGVRTEHPAKIGAKIIKRALRQLLQEVVSRETGMAEHAIPHGHAILFQTGFAPVLQRTVGEYGDSRRRQAQRDIQGAGRQ
ncbi:hypothetical protein D3C71_1899320 [compost metagenome]